MVVDTSRSTHTLDRELTISGVFDAPRELVFQAWTDPAQLARWWGPHGFSAPSVALDVTPGGAWRTCMRNDADGGELWASGVYREVVAPERLVFTYAWDTADGVPGHETLVTVTFDDLGDRTRMTFHQAAFQTVQDRDDHEGGWSECFDDLAAYLSELRATLRR
jgi:uncharacterized protein YndB with AHSA1/START domain